MKLIRPFFVAAVLLLIAACKPIPQPSTPAHCSVDTAQQLGTLSYLAYVSENDPLAIRSALVHALENPDLATAGQWHLAWGPASYEGHIVYVAEQRQQNTVAVVIRGTDFLELTNLDNDFDFAQQAVPSQYWLAGDEVRLSAGTVEGLQAIGQMRDPQTQQSLIDYVLTRLRAGEASIMVTGHSLGGGLTTVLLPWFHAAISQCQGCAEGPLGGYSFAGPSAGNIAFAEQFDEQFGQRFCRVVNPLDLVPKAWAGVIDALEEGVPTTLPKVDPPVAELFLGVQALLDLKGWDYQQVGGTMILEHSPATGSYFEQVLIQHSMNCYLKFLGAPQAGTADQQCKV